MGEQCRARMPDPATSDSASMIMKSYDDVRIDTYFVLQASNANQSRLMN